MNPSEQRRMLVIKAAAFVSVIYAYFMSRLRVARSSRPRICTGIDESFVAFSHLVDNKAQGDAFVNMTHSHRVLWLRTWLAKHYYM